MIVAIVMMAVTANAQSAKKSPKKDGVYNFTGKTTSTTSQDYFSKDKLSGLAAPKTIWEKITCPKQSMGAMYDPNYLGKSGVALVGTTGRTVGKHVATSMVATIGSSLENAHLSGISEYDLSNINGTLRGSYSTRALQCKTWDFGLTNQWEIGQLQIFKNCAISLFGGIFAKVSVEHGTETYSKTSYDTSIPSAYYQGGYSCFILSCGSQLGVNVKLGKWTLSVSENLTNGLWRAYDPLGPSQIGLVDVGQGDSRHPLTTNVGVTCKIK